MPCFCISFWNAERAMPLEFGPPVVPKPAAELLAEQLAAADRLPDALAAYEAVLQRTPGRTVAVEGLRQLKTAGVKREPPPPHVHVH
jgi:hypothetical protein